MLSGKGSLQKETMYSKHNGHCLFDSNGNQRYQKRVVILCLSSNQACLCLLHIAFLIDILGVVILITAPHFFFTNLAFVRLAASQYRLAFRSSEKVLEVVGKYGKRLNSTSMKSALKNVALH
ncbi:uncharacterized protein LY89DRAFT_89594 [Mollisia scopiformis]|uniref:Uncharacterized protein n=1 Tax=Mollisia scopiformis TaxID=149040 RepID=A0A194X618_MOLSC|nr:uncharacterized protein LY89DRAFT_89594 [Mollisia scopiformis]KUJ15618.1 hypothetical protein LY89DRAFT_89594 [Mollisia scopiformis]